MEGQLIISVSREFGSGGHDIAKKISEDFGIKFYDKNILDEIAKVKDTTADKLADFDEKRGGLLRRVLDIPGLGDSSVSEMQFSFLHKRAELGESFVVVGRCSEVVLKEFDGLFKVFVLGNKKEKLQRVMKKYELGADAALELMEESDKKRRHYHNYYSERKWGDSRAYDLCINSSHLGVNGTAEIIESYIKEALK